MIVSGGKWTKYKLMKEEEKLSSYLPETQLFSKKSLYEMLDKYNQIVFKPCLGYQGIGVIQITSLKNDQYELHEEIFKTKLNGRGRLYDYLIKKQQNKGKHILQQNIKLKAIDNNPFDIRVMVQYKKDSYSWEVTGKIVRVAAKGFFITNAAKKLLTVEETIGTSLLNRRTFNDIISEINETALLTAAHLKKYYSDCCLIGLDIGIDIQEKIWIIEANLHPGIRLFDRLKDKSMYNKIKKYY